MLGIPFGTKMTVVKLSSGDLWLHSPVNPNIQMFNNVSSLGQVSCLVAPNKLHHLYIKPWSEHFDSATVWVEPQLANRNLDFRFDKVLSESVCDEWSHDFDQLLFKGSSILSEAIFLHKSSKTLIVTDIIQNHDPEQENLLWRFVKRLNSILAPNGGVPRDWRLTVRDRREARNSVDKILSWDFERLIVSHGICMKENAKPFVEQAFGWL